MMTVTVMSMEQLEGVQALIDCAMLHEDPTHWPAELRRCATEGAVQVKRSLQSFKGERRDLSKLCGCCDEEEDRE